MVSRLDVRTSPSQSLAALRAGRVAARAAVTALNRKHQQLQRASALTLPNPACTCKVALSSLAVPHAFCDLDLNSSSLLAVPKTDAERQMVVARLDELYAATLLAVHEERTCARRCLRQFKQFLQAENEQPRSDPGAQRPFGRAGEHLGTELEDDDDDELDAPLMRP